MTLRRTLLFLLIVLVFPNPTVYGQGRLVYATVHSRALERNLLGDSADRSVLVYVPPSYETVTSKRYPVVYLLHGNGATDRIWTSGFFQGLNIASTMDSLITSGAVREMILVMPDASNKYLGSHYANSQVTGNWADFIGRELVEYIDLNYRTFRAAKSRGIAGHSMGGRGTLFIASKYPDTFGALYALSSGRMGFDSRPPFEDSTWLKLIALRAPQTPDRALLVPLGLSAAFSPNPDKPPYFVDLPVELSNGTVQRVDSVWQKWLAHDPITVVQENAGNLRSLRAIYFDCGRADKLISVNRLLSQVLTKLGIPHVFEEYDGNHGNKIRERLETKVLPLFSRVLIAN